MMIAALPAMSNGGSVVNMPDSQTTARLHLRCTTYILKRFRCRLWDPARQRGGLFHPARHLRLIQFLSFVDVDPPRLLALRRATRRNGLQRRATEECHLDVMREDMERQEPTPALNAV